MNLREAARQALEALDCPGKAKTADEQAAITALRAALLAERDQEPVAWMDREGDVYKKLPSEHWCPPHTALYAHPPQRKPLTDEEIESIRQVDDCGEDAPEFTRIFRVAERAHGIGDNT